MESMVASVQHAEGVTVLEFRQTNDTLCFSACQVQPRGVDKCRESFGLRVRVRVGFRVMLEDWAEATTEGSVKREDADERREEDNEKERGVGNKVIGMRVRLPVATLGIR